MADHVVDGGFSPPADRNRLRAERDKAQQLLRELLEWAEEQAEGAENVAEKLKREGDDFEDRAYYEDAERFTLQANIYRLTAQRIREEMEG